MRGQRTRRGGVVKGDVISSVAEKSLGPSLVVSAVAGRAFSAPSPPPPVVASKVAPTRSGARVEPRHSRTKRESRRATQTRACAGSAHGGAEGGACHSDGNREPSRAFTPSFPHKAGIQTRDADARMRRAAHTAERRRGVSFRSEPRTPRAFRRRRGQRTRWGGGGARWCCHFERSREISRGAVYP